MDGTPDDVTEIAELVRSRLIDFMHCLQYV